MPSKLKLAAIRVVSGERVPDVIRVMMYRSDFFGAPFCRYVQALLRGPSEWTLGERELFAAFVSHCNDCEFCTASHRAVASRALGSRTVAAVFEDWQSAPVSREVRAVLGFLQKLTRDPAAVERSDVDAALAEGVSEAALETAVHVCVAFTVINRVADALGFEVLSASGLAKSTDFLLKRGYRA
jgi:uncharacterized peroxidase-related enzyme